PLALPRHHVRRKPWAVSSSTARTCAFACTARWMLRRCARCSPWCANDDRAAFRHSGMARRRSDRHGEGHGRVGGAGANDARREPVLGSHLRLPWSARRSGEAAMVRRRRHVPVRQAARAWPLRVAAGAERFGGAQCGAARNAARRHRLAPPGANACARARSVGSRTELARYAVVNFETTTHAPLLLHAPMPSPQSAKIDNPQARASLPDDVETLKALVLQRDTEIEQLK